MKRFREAAVLRNSKKVSCSKAVTIFDIDNEIKSKFLGVEKTDNDGQTYWVVDNSKAVLTVVYDEWREKNEPLYKISIMRKAKIISAWEGIYFNEFKKDLEQAAYDWDVISPMTESKKSKECDLKENKRQLKENLEFGINLDNLFEVAEVAQNTLPENNLIYKLIDDLFNEFMCDEIVDDRKVARLEKMLRNSDSIEFGDFYNYLYDMLFTEKEFEQF